MKNNEEYNCMTLIAGKKASATGHVLIGHNEDDGGTYAVRHGWVPAQDWPAGTVLPAETGCAAIPQVPHTYGYWWTEVKSPRGGISNADTFLNECGVCIVSNSMCGSKEPENPDILTDGGMVYNLRRCLAERASSARDGARILTELMETYGYAQSGRAYTIADKDEVFMFQLMRGKHYMGARVPDDAVVVMPNHYTLGDLDDCPETFYPADLVEYCIQKGWYTPAVPGDYSDFHYAKAVQDPGEWRDRFNTYRQKFGQYRLLGMDPNVPVFPFCVRTDRKMKPSDFADVLSGHNEGLVPSFACFGPGLSIHETLEYPPICRTTTVESTVFALTEDIRDTFVFTAFGRPCGLPYVPLQPLRGLPDAIDPEHTAAARMASHTQKEYDAAAPKNDIETFYLHLETLIDLTRCDSIGAFAPLIARNRREMDALALAPAPLADCGNALFAQWKKDFSDAAEAAVRTVAVEPSAPLSFENTPETFRLEFSCPTRPDPYTLCAGLAHRSAKSEFSALSDPESLISLGGRRYAAVFRSKKLRGTVPCPGTYRVYLAGRDIDSRSFVGFTDLAFAE